MVPQTIIRQEVVRLAGYRSGEQVHRTIFARVRNSLLHDDSLEATPFVGRLHLPVKC